LVSLRLTSLKMRFPGKRLSCFFADQEPLLGCDDAVLAPDSGYHFLHSRQLAAGGSVIQTTCEHLARIFLPWCARFLLTPGSAKAQAILIGLRAFKQ
jgi:hypothetical protein